MNWKHLAGSAVIAALVVIAFGKVQFLKNLAS